MQKASGLQLDFSKLDSQKKNCRIERRGVCRLFLSRNDLLFFCGSSFEKSDCSEWNR